MHKELSSLHVAVSRSKISINCLSHYANFEMPANSTFDYSEVRVCISLVNRDTEAVSWNKTMRSKSKSVLARILRYSHLLLDDFYPNVRGSTEIYWPEFKWSAPKVRHCFCGQSHIRVLHQKNVEHPVKIPELFIGCWCEFCIPEFEFELDRVFDRFPRSARKINWHLQPYYKSCILRISDLHATYTRAWATVK